MNSKERVMCAINLEEPDRVPMTLHGTTWVQQRLCRDLDCHSHKELMLKLRSDIVDIRGVVDPTYVGPGEANEEISPGVFRNYLGWELREYETEFGIEADYDGFILQDAASIEEAAERFEWPKVDWFDFSGFAERLDAWQEFAVMVSSCSVFQHCTYLRHMEQFMLDLAMDQAMAEYLMDGYTDFYLAYFDKMFTEVKGRIDILRCADDLASQRSLMISPEMFRSLVAPRLKKLIDLAHSHGVKFFFHSCGALTPLIDDLIGLGIDILDPLQAAAEGMEPEILKARFGDRVCLHGSICTQYLLPNGTPEEVAVETKRRIDLLAPDGGFILAPCHVLQNDVSTANVMALSDTGYHYGQQVMAGH
ncbi:uroporphyrinogen decarboxylase family protein [Poriferisphaera sp. WC338]|uniref:uroporphyrinogen decarboxylase family protein n=1 Tax=Poriferisphaera sp. WC338 TaxID=3425129 RepID=UPI003D813E29